MFFCILVHAIFYFLSCLISICSIIFKCTFLNISENWYFFIVLLVIYNFCAVQCLFLSFAHFSTNVQFFLLFCKRRLHPFCCSVTKSHLTLCNPVDCSTPGFPVPHHLLEFAQVHVHWIGDAIQPSHYIHISIIYIANFIPSSFLFMRLLSMPKFKLLRFDHIKLFYDWCLESTNFFCKGTDDKYFRLCQPNGLSQLCLCRAETALEGSHWMGMSSF